MTQLILLTLDAVLLKLRENEKKVLKSFITCRNNVKQHVGTDL